jgi:glycosyltransferase involved in cell wall biosynthesis
MRTDGQRVGDEPSLYWFSQTIGPGRGLESVIEAMAHMRTRVRVHLRGLLSAGYRAELLANAQSVGVADRVHFLPPAPPSEMARLAACHDVGLALELNTPFNRSICLTNKAFVYLLAGLPVLFSDTPAQRELAAQLGRVASLADLSQPRQIGAILDRLLAHRIWHQELRREAWLLGQTRYNWDTEQGLYLQAIEDALDQSARERVRWGSS